MNKKATSIVFTGDIGFDRYMDRKWEDEQLLSKELLDFFHSADHVCASVEGALINAEDDGSRGIFFHSMNPEATAMYKKIGADLWAIGNNHSMDAGAEGVISTRKIAEELGCLAFGAGLNEVEASEPIYLDEAGGIGMFGVSYMAECIPATATEPGIFRWDDLDYIERRIKEIKEKCRWCIVVSHGGEEFTSLPSPYTRDRYLKFLELGADVVVGGHPHVTENYELFDDGKAIFYSLGNFIFDTDYQRVHLYTDEGVLLKLKFTEEKMDFEAIGTKIIRGPERIIEGPLPDVFTNIPAEEYELLAPLSTKAFALEDMRKMVYLERNDEEKPFAAAFPKELDGYFYSAELPEVWKTYFYDNIPEADGYFEKAHMDFSVILPISDKADEGLWKQSKLEKVKEYILKQFEGIEK